MKIYNKKGHLLPDSINSCASFHAKVFEDGRYIFRIHDCITGIRLQGDLITDVGIQEAKSKIKALKDALQDFENWLDVEFKDK